jgi:hypothetical protein
MDTSLPVVFTKADAIEQCEKQYQAMSKRDKALFLEREEKRKQVIAERAKWGVKEHITLINGMIISYYTNVEHTHQLFTSKKPIVKYDTVYITDDTLNGVMRSLSDAGWAVECHPRAYKQMPNINTIVTIREVSTLEYFGRAKPGGSSK